MGGSERTSQSDDERVDGSTVKEIEQRDVACTFVAGVTMMIFRQNGNSHIHTLTVFSGTTQVSRYQKGKISLDVTETRDSE